MKNNPVALQTIILALTSSLVLASGPIEPLANDGVIVYESPRPKDVYCYTPGICQLGNESSHPSRLVVTMDLGGKGTREFTRGWKIPLVEGQKSVSHVGQVFVSDDRGKTWRRSALYPFFQARPFVAGGALYVLGRDARQVAVMRSDDDGETWTPMSRLTGGEERWHQSACNVWKQNGSVYLVMEKTALNRNYKAWSVGALAPILMRADEDTDLTDPTSWTYATDLVFEDTFTADETDDIGVPFWPSKPKDYSYLVPPKGRGNAPPGWLETNVVAFPDPNHIWHDPTCRTFYLFSRAHTAGTGLCAISKVVEADDGSMTTSVVRAPSGQRMLFVPMPGGQMRFHVLYDERSKLYWLLSTQATDSMARPETLSKARFSIPNNERHRLQLHFSTNMIDWCFAGLVTKTDDPRQARHYASMCVDGDDLVVVSRSGDKKAKSAHDGNLITFHRIKAFRSLAY